MRRPLGRFIEAELLSGENRWRAGEHGLQDARKGMRFLQLPAVLQVKLALICKLTVFEELWLCETLHHASRTGLVFHFQHACVDGMLEARCVCGRSLC